MDDSENEVTLGWSSVTSRTIDTIAVTLDIANYEQRN